MTGQRIAMRRIEIEVATADKHVLRIWCFKDDGATRLQHAHGLIQKLNERIDRQMLDEVKASDGAKTCIVKTREVIDQILFRDLQAALDALPYENAIGIHADAAKFLFFQELEPLAASAADVENGHLPATDSVLLD